MVPPCAGAAVFALAPCDAPVESSGPAAFLIFFFRAPNWAVAGVASTKAARAAIASWTAPHELSLYGRNKPASGTRAFSLPVKIGALISSRGGFGASGGFGSSRRQPIGARRDNVAVIAYIGSSAGSILSCEEDQCASTCGRPFLQHCGELPSARSNLPIPRLPSLSWKR